MIALIDYDAGKYEKCGEGADISGGGGRLSHEKERRS